MTLPPFASCGPDTDWSFFKRGHVQQRQYHGAGFSLVEVAIAMGIISFALVALLGLLSVGVRAGKDSHDDTMAAEISRVAFSEWKSGTNNFSMGDSTMTNYYTYDAKRLSGAGSSAYFECLILNTTHSINLPGLTNGANVRRIRLELSWPVGAAASNRDRQIFETTVAKYE